MNPDYEAEMLEEGWATDGAAYYGYCNACGEEAEAFTECCEDGEVVPYE